MNRVSFLEKLLRCPRCLGSGTVQVRGEPDECPDCHGHKWRFME